jgi:hypothetical protein
MLIYDNTFARKEKVTSVKLNNMYANEINSVNDIHPQYNKAMLDPNQYYFSHLENSGGVGAVNFVVAPPTEGYSIIEPASLQNPTTTSMTVRANHVEFVKNKEVSLRIHAFIMTDNTGGATCTAKYKISTMSPTDGSATAVLTGSDKSVTNDIAWHSVDFDNGSAVDISSISDGLWVRVQIELTSHIGTSQWVKMYSNLLKVTAAYLS